MQRPRVLVTAAAGQTGAAVTRQLRAAGYPVRALVRRTDARSTALEAIGAEVVVADMGDPEAMAKALRDVQRAYFVAAVEPAMLHQAVVFTTAARDAKLEHVVQMTQWLSSPAHPALATRQHWLADRLLPMIPGATHTLVQPGLFADQPFLSTLKVVAHLGLYPWVFGKGRNAPPSVEDIARVVAAALQDPAKHADRRYRPTGPELLDGEAMARILARVVNRSVRLVPTPPWLFVRGARLEGIPVMPLAMLKHWAEDQREGAFELGAPNDHVLAATGTPPESFETVARRHVASLPRGIGARLLTFARFMVAPLLPVPVDRFVRELHMPVPPRAMSAASSPTWRREHGVEPSSASRAEDGGHTPSQLVELRS